MDIKSNFKRFRAFLKEDSWPSFFVGLLIALIVIKFIIFPVLTLITGTPLPLVIVESCSMYHQFDLDQIVQNKIYSDYDLDYSNTSNWVLKNGFTKGDIIIVISPKNLKIGDVLIFNAGQTNPIIHRVINIDESGKVTTKGDNNFGLLEAEKKISEEQFVGKAVFKIPAIGWIKLIFFDWRKPENQRGFC
jgi:hypothetical protein